MATGWLIRNDVVVTAGHCSFDHNHNLDQLVSIRAYMGYKGRESVDDPKFQVQLRYGKVVATSPDWVEQGVDEAKDVSFILLDHPFTGIKPFVFQTTPEKGWYTLGIVGYPGDLENPLTREKGAFMYEMFGPEKYDLDTAVNDRMHLLQYNIDTFGGNSGSPVLIRTGRGDLRPIGVHVFGGDLNSASMIGPHGNSFDSYVAALGALDTGSTAYPSHSNSDRPWLTYLEMPGGGPAPPKPDSGQPSGGSTEFYEDGPESLGGSIPGVDTTFLSVLNKAVGVVKPVGPTEALMDNSKPILLGKNIGHIAPQIAALSAFALHTAGKMAASRTGTEADIKTYSFEGAAERAILGEAAIAAIKHMGNAKCKEEGIFETMTDIVKVLKPTVVGAAPKILPAVTESALRIAIDNLAKAKATNAEDCSASPIVRELKPLQKETDYRGVGFIPESELSEFATGFREVCTKNEAQEFLGLATTIGRVIGAGLNLLGPILGTVAKKGLSLFLGGSEDAEGIASTPVFEGYAERAIIGEAALRSVIKLGTPKCFQEGLFDVMTKIVSQVAPVVLQAAPVVIRAVTPIVRDMMQKREAASRTGTELFGGTVPQDPDVAIKWPLMELHEINDLRRGEGVPTYNFANIMAAMNQPPQVGPALEAALIIPAQLVESIHHRGDDEPAKVGQATVLFAFRRYARMLEHDTVGQHIPHARYAEVFGRHRPLAGNPPNLIGMFGLQVHVFGAVENPNGLVQQWTAQPAGFYTLLLRLLGNVEGEVRYFPEAGPGHAEDDRDVELVVRVGENVPGNYVSITMSLPSYARLLRQMMTTFTFNVTGHELEIWQTM